VALAWGEWGGGLEEYCAEDIVQSLKKIKGVITTVLNMRTPGMTMHRLPLFVWAVFITAILLLLSLPVFAGSLNCAGIKFGYMRETPKEDNPQETYDLLTGRHGGKALLPTDSGASRRHHIGSSETTRHNFSNMTGGGEGLANPTLKGRDCSWGGVPPHHHLKQSNSGGPRPVTDCSSPPPSAPTQRSTFTEIPNDSAFPAPAPKDVQQIPNRNFNYYLAGLIEGDGCIVTPLFERDKKGRLTYPSIQISFGLMDLPLALMVQKTIGHGSLARVKGKRAYVYTINNKEGVLKTIELVNGRFRTVKNKSLGKIIKWYRDKNETEIEHLPIDKTPLGSTSWLSGFIEADGHFAIRLTEKPAQRVECKMELCHAKESIYGSSYDALIEISEYLGCALKEIRVGRKHPQYRLRTSSIPGRGGESHHPSPKEANKKVMEYLNRYPLKGKKHLDFLSWLEVAEIFMGGKVTHKELAHFAKEIKSQMNDRRQIFTWDHLEEFYIIEK